MISELKRLLLRVLFVIFIAILSVPAIAQGLAQTPYEKKIEELQVKYLKVMEFTEREVNEFLWYDSDERISVFSLAILSKPGSMSKSEFEQMLNQFKDAEKLKTAYEIEREMQEKLLEAEEERLRKEKAEMHKLKAEQEKQEREQREQDIKSKTYDLYDYAPSKYDQVRIKLRKEIVDYFASNKTIEEFASYETLENADIKYERFNSTYNVYFKIQPNYASNPIEGSTVQSQSKNINIVKKIELAKGTDDDLKVFKSVSIALPTIKIEGYDVMTDATFDNIKVDFARGLTVVKINDEKVDFVKHIPDSDLQDAIIKKIKANPKGKYLVRYEISDVLGEMHVKTETEKIKNNLGKVLQAGGGIVLLGGIIYLVAEYGE